MALAPLDMQAVRASLRTSVVGSRLVHLDTTESTMEEARREGASGAPEGTVVVAEEQRGGRGRHGRPWYSPRGNLYCSVLLRPTPWALPRLTMAAGLAVLEAIRTTTPLAPTLKWPNDVLVNGRKVCGIIVEVSWEGPRLAHAVLGMGINVHLDPTRYPDIAMTATSLSREAGYPVAREELLIHLLWQLDSLHAGLREGRSPREAWVGELETLGRWVQVTWEGESVAGQAEAVDEEGNLVLRLPDGTTRVIAGGEVIQGAPR